MEKILPPFIFVLRCTASAMTAYLLAVALRLEYPIWALVSAIVVAQEVLAETWTIVFRRIWGTALGVVVAVTLHSLVHPMGMSLAMEAGLCIALCTGISYGRPALRASMWTGAIVLLTADPREPLYLTGISRGAEVIMGGLIGGLFHFIVEKGITLVKKEAQG